MNPETIAEVAVLRQKSAEGTLTQDDMKKAIRFLRADRRSAAAASEISRRGKAKAAIPSADDMLDQLGGL